MTRPADELEITEELVGSLLASQFPQVADLPVRAFEHSGTDHAMFRLGDGLAVRLPRVAWAVDTLRKEQHWLPRLAHVLPVQTPVPLGIGDPGPDYPWPWTISAWLAGETPVPGHLTEPLALARDLAGFITALRAVDTSGAPATVWPDPLHAEDGRVRSLLPDLSVRPSVRGLDVAAVEHAWAAAVAAPPCSRRTWIHGDLAQGNLLLLGDRLHGVIDFGAMGLGDPASDLRPAWNLLPAEARDEFREAVGADEGEWSRGRGWALLQAVVQLDVFTGRNDTLVTNARLVLAQIAAEVQGGSV